MAALVPLIDDKCVETPYCIRPVVYQLINANGAKLGLYCQQHAHVAVARLAAHERETHIPAGSDADRRPDR